jgi:hypothetical protein
MSDLQVRLIYQQGEGTTYDKVYRTKDATYHYEYGFPSNYWVKIKANGVREELDDNSIITVSKEDFSNLTGNQLSWNLADLKTTTKRPSEAQLNAVIHIIGRMFFLDVNVSSGQPRMVMDEGYIQALLKVQPELNDNDNALIFLSLMAPEAAMDYYNQWIEELSANAEYRPEAISLLRRIGDRVFIPTDLASSLYGSSDDFKAYFKSMKKSFGRYGILRQAIDTVTLGISGTLYLIEGNKGAFKWCRVELLQ